MTVPTLPYPKPTTLEQARNNAIAYAEAAASTIVAGGDINRTLALGRMAEVWSQIANLMPLETDMAYTGPPADDAPSTDLDSTVILHSDQSAAGPMINTNTTAPTVTVSAVAWDVLRVLAVRYVRGSLTPDQAVVVDLVNDMEDVQLVFAQMPDSSIVHLYCNRT